MSDTSASSGPVDIEFAQFHQPPLRDGVYEVHVVQEISYPGLITASNTFETTTQKFRIAGERFRLNPTDIHAVFPPDGSTGDHAMVLPHIVLARSTLPWERWAAEGDKATPWLALLVFDEDDAPHVLPHDVTYAKLAPTQATDPRYAVVAREHEADDEAMSVIDVPWSRLAPLLPSRQELQWQTHVRSTTDGKNPGAERAVIFANRLPQPGQTTTVHLVSLEEWFAPDQGDAPATQIAATDTVRLVTLESWRFSCDQQAGAFEHKVERLNLDPPSLRLPGVHVEPTPLLAAGGVPLAHTLRDGGRTVSIYRGPLVAYTQASAITDPRVGRPVASADEWLVYHEALGLFDTSYAAAWELGRQLTLSSGRVATELFQWKRAHAQHRHLARQITRHPHLPGHQRAARKASPAPLPEVVQSWYDDLSLLRHLPFNYLVPNEAMLPVESMRCFSVDPVWIGALIDGAFSLGRVGTAEVEADLERRAAIAWPTRPISGVLLRSSVVTGWPDLLIDGYNRKLGANETPPDDQPPPLRLERLGQDVMLALFEGEVQCVDVHLRPESLHFGFDIDDTAVPVRYVKTLRSGQGDTTSAPQLTVPWARGDSASRRIDMAQFGRTMHEALGVAGLMAADEPFTSSHMALEMIEGVQKVRFNFG